MRLFFSFSNNILVAERNGEIVGGVILKVFLLPKSIKAGLVSLIFCSPRYSGQGIGQLLADEGVKCLEKEGCSDIFACVEGDNTGSSKLFVTSGFNRLSLLQQIKAYGFGCLPIWFHSYHFFDIGHFMWSKSSRTAQVSNTDKSNMLFELLFIIVAHVTIFSIALWRQEIEDYSSVESILTLLVCFSAFYETRYSAMLCVAWANNIKYELRMWESGLSLSFCIALLFGGGMVSPGSLYPRGNNWKYHEHLQHLGVMALVSSACLIGAVWTIGGLIKFNLLPSMYLSSFETAFSIGVGLLILDVVLPFFPFSSFSGKRLWDWNKYIWGILSLSIVPFFIVF
nr:GNAT family N-acetyltransferase [Vibrio sp. Of7-15]